MRHGKEVHKQTRTAL